MQTKCISQIWRWSQLEQSSACVCLILVPKLAQCISSTWRLILGRSSIFHLLCSSHILILLWCIIMDYEINYEMVLQACSSTCRGIGTSEWPREDQAAEGQEKDSEAFDSLIHSSQYPPLNVSAMMPCCLSDLCQKLKLISITRTLVTWRLECVSRAWSNASRYRPSVVTTCKLSSTILSLSNDCSLRLCINCFK